MERAMTEALAREHLPAAGSRRDGIERGSVKLRPWIVSLLGGVGLTALGVGAFALWASPALLDSAASLGERRLIEIVLAGLAVSWALCRLVLIRRPLPEERVDEAPQRPQPRHLR
jgi:hypothetical protein